MEIILEGKIQRQLCQTYRVNAHMSNMSFGLLWNMSVKTYRVNRGFILHVLSVKKTKVDRPMTLYRYHYRMWVFTLKQVIWLDINGHMTPKTRRLHINKLSLSNDKLTLPGYRC